jgi:hypothetical protein
MHAQTPFPIETISSAPAIDERRALLMALQAMLDPTMLRVIAALHAGERSMAQLAAELDLPPSFSRGPLGRLIYLELVAVRQEDGRMLCALDSERLHQLNGALQRLSRELLAEPDQRSIAELAPTLDELDRKLLRGFLRGEQLISIPVGPERLQPILRWLVTKFEPGRRYPEREVNAMLGTHHEDFATLRRALVDFRYMDRADQVYWRRDELPTEW